MHLLAGYPPKVAVSALVNSLNGVPARKSRSEFTGQVNRHIMHGHLWYPSSFAASCGGAPLSITRHYIKEQRAPANASSGLTPLFRAEGPGLRPAIWVSSRFVPDHPRPLRTAAVRRGGAGPVLSGESPLLSGGTGHPAAALRYESPPGSAGMCAWRTGTWPSLVGHLTGGQGVAGSNPAVPTEFCRSEGF